MLSVCHYSAHSSDIAFGGIVLLYSLLSNRSSISRSWCWYCSHSAKSWWTLACTIARVRVGVVNATKSGAQRSRVRTVPVLRGRGISLFLIEIRD